MKRLLRGGAAEGGAAAHSGTVVATSKIHIITLLPENIGAVAGNAFNTRPGKFERHLRQLRKALFKTGAVCRLTCAELNVAQQAATVILRRVTDLDATVIGQAQCSTATV